MLINFKTRYLPNFFFDLISAFGKFHGILRYLLLKNISFALNFKSFMFLIFLHVQLFVIYILFYLNLRHFINYALIYLKDSYLFELLFQIR